MPIKRPLLWFPAALAAALLLSACSDQEPEQRAAFIDFLKVRIVDKPGVHVPKLSDEEKSRFGDDYTEQYAVISDYSERMNEIAGRKLGNALSQGSITTLGQAVEHRQDIQDARDTLKRIDDGLQEEVAKAQNAKDGLDQPDDLKVVYDQAFERIVTTPAATLEEVFPGVDRMFGAVLALVDYTEQHKDAIDLSGSIPQVSDPAVQQQLASLLQDVNRNARDAQEAQQKMRTVVYGK